jgi:hypothetical protein
VVNDGLVGLLHEVVTEHEHYPGGVAVKIEDHHQDRDQQQPAAGGEDVHPQAAPGKDGKQFFHVRISFSAPVFIEREVRLSYDDGATNRGITPGKPEY